MKVAEIIEKKVNFPIPGEAYVVGRGENGKYFFAWGSEIPYANKVPVEDISSIKSGIIWFETKGAAIAAMKAAVKAFD